MQAIKTIITFVSIEKQNVVVNYFLLQRSRKLFLNGQFQCVHFRLATKIKNVLIQVTDTSALKMEPIGQTAPSVAVSRNLSVAG